MIQQGHQFDPEFIPKLKKDKYKTSNTSWEGGELKFESLRIWMCKTPAWRRFRILTFEDWRPASF